MKTTINKGINYVMYCAGLLVTGSGLALAWKLPRGPQGRRTELLDLSRHGWSDIHLWAGVFLVAAIVIHLALHWQWIWQVASNRVPWKAWTGIALPVIGCLVLLAAPPDRSASRLANTPSKIDPSEPAQSETYGADEFHRRRHSMRGNDRLFRSGGNPRP